MESPGERVGGRSMGGPKDLLFSWQAKKELHDDVETINGAMPNAGSLRNPVWKFV